MYVGTVLFVAAFGAFGAVQSFRSCRGCPKLSGLSGLSGAFEAVGAVMSGRRRVECIWASMGGFERVERAIERAERSGLLELLLLFGRFVLGTVTGRGACMCGKVVRGRMRQCCACRQTCMQGGVKACVLAAPSCRCRCFRCRRRLCRCRCRRCRRRCRCRCCRCCSCPAAMLWHCYPPGGVL